MQAFTDKFTHMYDSDKCCVDTNSIFSNIFMPSGTRSGFLSQ